MVTQRDKIWATSLQLIEHQRSISAADVKEAIDGDGPAIRTIRNTLNAMEVLELFDSEGGSGRSPRRYHPIEPEPTSEPPGYSPRKSSSTSKLPYPGGKSKLAPWIIQHIPQHDTYVEVFGGGAGVLFNKPRSKYEIYNDVDGDLTQFFRVLRERPSDLAEWLVSVPYSRAQYEQWVEEFYRGVRPDDPIERAGRFFSLRYMQYAGISSAPNGFKTRAKRSPARTFDNARRRIQSMARRFAQVTVENLGYEDVLSTYDDRSVDVVFYADPPYLEAEEHYGSGFNHDEFVDKLHDVESDWLVSYEKLPAGLENFTILERESRHRMRRKSGNVTEKLVCNFDPADRISFTSAITS